MNGMAERQQGYSRRLVNALRVGQNCTLSDIAGLLDRQTNALAGRGVYRNTGADCFVIFVTLDKKPDATQWACQEFCVIEILIHSLTLSPKTMENWLRASPQFLIG